MTSTHISEHDHRTTREPAVCVVGLGRVGMSIATAMACRGVVVRGVDLDPLRVAMVNGHTRAVDDEPGLAAALRQRPFHATISHAEAVRGSSLSYVIVPTPSDDRGGYELHHVRQAFEQIGRALAQHDRPHTVVLASTVLPGATRYVLRPVLEDAAGRVVGDGLNLCYSPPFIALGSVMRDFLQPDFVLIGVAEGGSGSDLQALYTSVLGRTVPLKLMSIDNAELTKLAVNTFLTMKISFANTLAALCDRLPGGDVDAVTDALGSDSRIGPRLTTGGLGYGGPCLPRDNAALALLAEAIGVPSMLPRATDAVDQQLSVDLVANLLGRLEPGRSAVVLGLAYKPSTSVVDASPGLRLATALAHAGILVHGYDPRAGTATRSALAAGSPAGAIDIVDDPAELPQTPDLVVLAIPDDSLADLALRLRPALLADPWRLLARERWPQGTEVVQYGRPSAAHSDQEAFAAIRHLSTAIRHETGA